jgi:c-di-GMP-binding flagellar brake protein YcgR
MTTPYDAITDDEMVHQLVDGGCAANAALDVRVRGKSTTENYKSMLYEITLLDDKRVVSIALPTHDGTVVPLSRNAKLEVHFMVRDKRYLFHTSLLGRSEFALSAGTKVQTLLVSYPGILERAQRRRYYRVGPSPFQTIEVRIQALREEKRPKQKKWTYKEKKEKDFITAKLRDISAGGIAVQLGLRDAPRYEIGARLRVTFDINDSEEEMKFNVVVRNHRETGTHPPEIVYGLELVDVETSLEGRQQTNRIFRYVARRQREELARVSGGEKAERA